MTLARSPCLVRPLAAVLPAALVAALASGCAVGPEHRVPDVEQPTAFATQAASFTSADPAEQWWRALNDPLLDSLVAEALAGNLGLTRAGARVREARAARNAEAGAAAPQFDASGKVSRDSISLNGENLANLPPGFTPRRSFTDYRVGFDASWELDFFGRTRRAVEAADARTDSAREAQRDAALTVAAEVVRTYVDHRLDRVRIEVARRSADAFANTSQLVLRQRNAGLAADLDVQRAESDAASARAAIEPLEAESRVALYRLGVLTGKPPAALAAWIAARQTAQFEGDASLPPLPDAIAIGLPSDLVRRRPDIRRAERELAAATADVGVVTADRFPRFALVGSLGLESIRPGQLVDQASRFFTVGPQLLVPIFSGGRLASRVEAREAARDAAIADYRKAVLEAFADVESALIRYDRERARAADLDTAEKKLEGTLALTRIRYRAGDTTLIDVLDVERRAIQARDASAQSQGQLATQWIALHKALGGGWEGAR
ncbi:MAG: efflux transporter outer membrane subunit [Burkholderiaceae bacterium]